LRQFDEYHAQDAAQAQRLRRAMVAANALGLDLSPFGHGTPRNYAALRCLSCTGSIRSISEGVVQVGGDRRMVLRMTAASSLALLLPSVHACEFVTDTLRVTHPWSRATEPGAQSAVLGMRIDQVTQADRLIEVRTPIATGAELAQEPGRPLDLEILPGSELDLSEVGVHVRLTGLKAQLFTGRDYPLSLVFQSGGFVDARLIVDQAVLPTFRFR
jgi:copper(I)-binding protein